MYLSAILKKNWMKSENIRTIVEIIGISAVVVSLIFVWAELDQSQSALEASALASRNEKTAEIAMLAYELDANGISQKIVSNEELSDDEGSRIRLFANTLMWHLETIYFEYSQGLIDDELWESNLNALSRAVRSPWFNYVFPNWASSGAASFRKSYIELVDSLIE
jgi:hypothetical protein